MVQPGYPGQVSGLRPARLKVGIISAGRVGTALGVALERAEHIVVACSAVSAASVGRAERRLPDTLIRPVDKVAADSELLILAVPDSELTTLVTGLAATGSVHSGTIVVHTSGANGIAILAPLTELGCVPLAIHPAMTFTGGEEDIARLSSSSENGKGSITFRRNLPRPTRSAMRSRSRWCWRSGVNRSGSGRTLGRCITRRWRTVPITS